MKQFWAFLILTFIAFTYASDIQTEEGVLILTDKNFDEAIKSNPMILVEYYAPWCGHCKSLAPEYAKAAQELAASENPVPLGKVDATVEKEIAQKAEIKGYPTLKFYVDGVPSEYNGGRTAKEIVAWLRKKSGPSVLEVSTQADLDSHIDKNEICAVFFGDLSSSNYEIYKKISRQFDDVIFLQADSSIAQAKGINDKEEIVLFRKFEEPTVECNCDLSSEESVKSFIETNSVPTIMEFDQKAAEIIFGNQKSAVILFIGADAKSDAAYEAFKEASQDLKGKIYLSKSQIEEGIGKRLADYIGVKQDNLPCVKIVNLEDGDIRKFQLDGEITSDSIKSFYDEYVKGKLVPQLKSQEIPAEPFENDVCILVGKNFNEIVNDPNYHVFVKFYAPWCGHCKSLIPIWEKLAAKYKDSKHVKICKMDSTENEVESVSIKGFPTLKFFSKSNKAAPLEYSEDRTFEAFVKYLEKNAPETSTEEVSGDVPKSDL